MRGSDVGLPGKFQAVGYTSTRYFILLTVLDYLFTSLIVCPCVVGYWRSVWNLMGIYVCPQDEWLSAVISMCIGILGHVFFSLSQNCFRDHFHPEKSRLVYYVVSRLYTLCFAFICVNGWRGPWQLLDLHAKKKVFTVLATTMVGVVALVSIRALRNVSASPFIVVTDKAKGYFEVITMFRIPVDKFTGLYILDCLFSILIVGILVVFIWRGCWVLVDLFLFPQDENLSAWGSLILGYSTVTLTFLLQPAARYMCEAIRGTSRLLIADFLNIFALFGTVNVWRGIWNLLDIYFLPDRPELSSWITHWMSFIILVLLGCSNSLLVRGVYIDAEEPAGKCVEFPCYYLRLLLQEDKLKKMNQDESNNSKCSNKNEKALDTFVNISIIHTPPSLENSTNDC